MESAAAIREIPLERLVLSPANVRKTPASADAELKASIAAHGLKQNLVVHPAGAAGDYAVIAGGRRLQALQALHADGVLPADHPVPCHVQDLASAETSLAENAVRCAMHPADQFEAMAGLIDAGETVPAIAARFGTSERQVRQRLKLGKVAPELLQAYRDEKLDLEALMAFTLAEDHEAQLGVWSTVRDANHIPAHWVRRLLTEERISTTSRLGRFVGLEAYEAAGGPLTRDLFSERGEAFMDDPQLVRRLADEKLRAAAETISGGWKWVEPVAEADYSITSGFRRIYPEPADAPPEIAEELARIDAREDELQGLEDWTEESEAEAEQLGDRRAAIEEQLDGTAAYRDEDRRRAGCIVTIGYNGELQVHEGLVKPEDADGASSQGTAGAQTLEGDAGKANGFSQALVEDLAAHRLQITKAHLAQDFGAAFDLALYCLCVDVLQVGYRAQPLDLRATPTPEVSSRADLKDTRAAGALAARHAGLETGWLSLPPAEGFQVFCDLPEATKRALFAWCVAQCLKPQLGTQNGANPVTEQLGERLGIDFAAYWRPTADNYWGRVKKAHALAIGGAVLGETWRRAHADDKKCALAKVLEAAFAGDGQATVGLDPETQARAAAWIPPGMAYGPADAAAAAAGGEVTP